MSGVHDTRRPAQRNDRTARGGGLGERAHPDTRAGVGVQLHSMGLPVREIAAVLDLLGVDRSHGTVWILSVLTVALFSIGRNIAQLGRSPSTKDMFTSA